MTTGQRKYINITQHRLTWETHKQHDNSIALEPLRHQLNIPETPLKLSRRLYWTETDCTRWQQLALQASGPKATRLSTALEPPGTQKELAACVISNLGFSLVKPCCRSTFSKQLFHLLGSEQAHAGLQQMSMTGLHQDHVSFFDHSSHDTRCSGIMLRVLGLTAWRLGLSSGQRFKRRV